MNTIQYEYLYVLDGNKTLKPNYLKVNKPNILTERVIFCYKRSIQKILLLRPEKKVATTNPIGRQTLQCDKPYSATNSRKNQVQSPCFKKSSKLFQQNPPTGEAKVCLPTFHNGDGCAYIHRQKTRWRQRKLTACNQGKCLQPYLVEHISSRLIPEVKQHFGIFIVLVDYATSTL